MGARSTGNFPTSTKADGHLLKYFRSNMGVGGGAIVPPKFTATGGTKIVAEDGFTYHVYLSDGSFVQNNIDSIAGNLNVLIVSGGGSGGGYYYAGGGGAGGVVESTGVSFDGTAAIVVGSGGAQAAAEETGNPGSNASFNGVTAVGGGGGGSYDPLPAGLTGGSAGGPSGYAGTNVIATPQSVPADYTAYGNPSGAGGSYGAGGGGGAGAVGATGTTDLGGAGGAGRAFPAFPAPIIAPAIPSPVRSTWTSTVGPTGIFAGGGGGSNYSNRGPGAPSPGGIGGGGAGGGVSAGTNTAGLNYTGSGGGGANENGVGEIGGNGIVIIKYQT